jgi:hypothetical protein
MSGSGFNRQTISGRAEDDRAAPGTKPGWPLLLMPSWISFSQPRSWGWSFQYSKVAITLFPRSEVRWQTSTKRALSPIRRGFHTLVHLSFRSSSQCQFCPSPNQSYRQHRPGSLRVVANRTAPLRVPKLGTVFELIHPRAVYVADKAVRAFDRGFIAIPSEVHNRGVLGNVWRSRAPRQGDPSLRSTRY